MTDETDALAERLLDAHVAHLAEELSGPQATTLVVAEARELIDALADVPVGQLLDGPALVATATAVVDAVGGSAAIHEMVVALVPALYGLEASDDHELGELVDRAHVEEIVGVLAASETLREEVLRRLGQSPTAAVLAMRFVTALVGDAVQQNRERAEKVPGVRSLLGVGDFAARQARGLAPKQLEKVVGGAADRGAQAAMDRLSRALVETLDEQVVHEAAMEVWDLHAADSVGGLRAYLRAEELEVLAGHGRAAWDELHTTAWFRAVVTAAVEGFLDRYGDHTLAELLEALDVEVDLLLAVVERHAPRIIDALHRDGHLEAFLRRRLEGFYTSEAAREVLAGAS